MINGVSGTPIQMNGGKVKNFLTQALKPKIGDSFPPPPLQANVKLRLTQAPKA